MKRKNYLTLTLFVIGLSLLFASCSKEHFMDREEEKLIGYWKIDKATFTPVNKNSSTTITSEFGGMELRFSEGYFASSTDDSLVMEGDWELREIKNTTGTYVDENGYATEEYETSFLLDINLVNLQTGDSESFMGTDAVVKKDKLTFFEEKRGGRYWYRWKKI